MWHILCNNTDNWAPPYFNIYISVIDAIIANNIHDSAPDTLYYILLIDDGVIGAYDLNNAVNSSPYIVNILYCYY